MADRRLFKPHASQIEAWAKRGMWSTVALVGVTDADVFRRLLTTLHGKTVITVIATWPRKSDQPSERIKQVARAEMVRKLARAYSNRVVLLECGPLEAADRLAGQMFDGAVLFATDEDLAEAGGAWAGMVASGGMLLGTDWRDLDTRAVLNAVAPSWERFDDGLWCVRVKRQQAVDLAHDGLEEDASLGHVEGSSPLSGDDAAHDLVAAHEPSVAADKIPQPIKRRPGRPRKHAA